MVAQLAVPVRRRAELDHRVGRRRSDQPRLHRDRRRLRRSAGLDRADHGPRQVGASRGAGRGRGAGPGGRRSATAGRRSTRRRSGRPPSASCSSTSASPRAEAREAGAGWGGDRPWSRRARTMRLPWPGGWRGTRRRTPRNSWPRTRPSSDGLDFPASVTELPNGEVLVAHASTEELLRQTVDAAELTAYIESGAEIPSRSRPLTSTERVASTSARRADESASSSVSTLQSR